MALRELSWVINKYKVRESLAECKLKRQGTLLFTYQNAKMKPKGPHGIL